MLIERLHFLKFENKQSGFVLKVPKWHYEYIIYFQL